MGYYKDHPFVAGAKVLVRRHTMYGDGVTNVWIKSVDKVYKNGNFTLSGDLQRQQYYASPPNSLSKTWKAYPTGDYRGRVYVELLTEETRSAAEKEESDYKRLLAFDDARTGVSRMSRSAADDELIDATIKAWDDYEKRCAAREKLAL
jgi:hypothetical protein